MAAGVFKLTLRLLMSSLGKEAVDTLLACYWQDVSPELFASSEAMGFADHLEAAHLNVSYLPEVPASERAVVSTLLDGRSRVVPFAFDPLVVLRALAEARIPESPPKGNFEAEVTPDSARSDKDLLRLRLL